MTVLTSRVFILSIASSLLLAQPVPPADAAGVLTHDITRVSLASDGSESLESSRDPSLNEDGTKIAFSTRGLLVPEDTGRILDIYLHDTATGTTTPISVAPGGTLGTEDSYNPVLSADGTKVAFSSSASNLVAGDTNGFVDVFLHDTVTGETARISVGPDNSQGSGHSGAPSISADGTKVAFISDAELVNDDTNDRRDIYLYDAMTGITSLASIHTTGEQGLGDSYRPAISADGTRIAFSSDAPNLVDGDTNSRRDVFLRDMVSGTTRRVSLTATGQQATRHSAYFYPGGSNQDVAINGDGTKIAFTSVSGDLVSGDTNGQQDVFVRDIVAGTTHRVSVGTGGIEPNDRSLSVAMSDGGSRVAFSSDASNLVADDDNGSRDVFVHDLVAGKTMRVSVAADRSQADWISFSADISGDGASVAFWSRATNLVPGDTNGRDDVFLTSSNCCVDSDADGLDDDEEGFLGTNPLVADTDGDGLSDGNEVTDLGTDPLTFTDTDGDGLGDGNELVIYLTDPLLIDSDGDGVTDPDEVAAETNPTAPVALFNADIGEWHLRARDGTTSSFYYGIPGDIPLLGDWDCDGTATVGMYRPSNGFAYLRNSNDFGVGEIEFFFGIPGDQPVVGDWDNDDCDTLGIYRDGEVLLSNTLATGPADIGFFFGTPGDTAFTGDFDADGITEIGLYRESTGFAYLRFDHSTGIADTEFFYGIPDDQVITGDWNHDGTDTVGIWRSSTNSFYLSDTNTTTIADYRFPYLEPGGWTPVAGEFH